MYNILIKVKYMAVHCDNYQCGRGNVFEGEEFFALKDNDPIYVIFNEDIFGKVKEKHPWVDNFSILSYEVIKEALSERM